MMTVKNFMINIKDKHSIIGGSRKLLSTESIRLIINDINKMIIIIKIKLSEIIN